MVDEAQRHRTTFDPREQYIMQEDMFSQPKDTPYNIGTNYQGDAETSGLGSFLATPFNWFEENVGGRINANERYYNPPGGKTTSIFKVGDTPVSAVDAFQKWNWGRGETPSFNLGSLLSSPYTGMGIDAALRDYGDDESKAYWAEQPYQQRLKEAGIPYNALPSSTFTPGMSRFENTLGFNVDLGSLFGLNLGDFNLNYKRDFDDDRALLELLYNVEF